MILKLFNRYYAPIDGSPFVVKDSPVDMIEKLLDRFESINSSTEKHPLAHDVTVVLTGRHLPQHVGPPSFRARGHGNGPADNGFHALPRESDSFLRAARDPRLIEHVYPRSRVILLNEVDDVGVMSPATAHEYLIDVLRRSIALVVVDDGLSGNSSDGRNKIVRRKAVSLGFLD